MEIKTEYDIGDEIYFLETETVVSYRECILCNGLKQVEIKGRLYVCPECKGSGSFTEVKRDKLKVSKPYWISYIEVKHFHSQDEISYWATDEPNDIKRNEFGGIWNKYVYKTYEDAVMECNRKNKENGYN